MLHCLLPSLTSFSQTFELSDGRFYLLQQLVLAEDPVSRFDIRVQRTIIL